MRSWTRAGIAALVLLGACKTVVTTTSEIYPSRYAVIEFTRQVSHNAIMDYAARAVREENLKVQKVDDAAGTVTAGPVKFAADGDQPALDATVTISTESTGNETRVRILASSILEQNQVGGRDARLAALVQRVNQRLEALIGN